MHCALGGLLQLPGQSASLRQTALPSWQLPEAGQSELFAHACPVLLHAPPMIAQSLATAQSLWSMLHWPTLGQGPMQLAPVRLHAPGWGVQSEFWVQLLVV